MSFWDEIKNFTKPYNDDEEDFDDFDDEMDDTFEEPAAEQPQRTSRFSRRESASAETTTFNAAPVSSTNAFTPASGSGFSGQVVSSASNKTQLILVRPESFNDAPTIAANMCAKKAVVLNLEGVEKSLARRIVDFLTGCNYAMEGSVKKVSQSTYVFCPHNMEVLGDLKNLQGEVENYV